MESVRAVDEDDVDRARTRRTGISHLDVNTPRFDELRD